MGTTNPEYQPLQVLWRPFMCLHSKDHPVGTNNPFSKQIVPSLYQESSTSISLQPVSPVPLVRLINHFLPSKTFFTHIISFFIFITHLFVGLRELTYLNPGSIFFIYAFTITTHFLMDFSQTCTRASLMYALPVILFSV